MTVAGEMVIEREGQQRTDVEWSAAMIELIGNIERHHGEKDVWAPSALPDVAIFTGPMDAAYLTTKYLVKTYEDGVEIEAGWPTARAGKIRVTYCETKKDLNGLNLVAAYIDDRYVSEDLKTTIARRIQSRAGGEGPSK